MFEADNRVKMFLSRSFYEAGRYEDAADIIKNLNSANFTFSNEDKPLIINIWMSIVSPLRTAILNMEADAEPGDAINTAIKTLKDILSEKTNEIISLLRSSIIPSAETDELRANYTKYLADFLRYKLLSLSSSEYDKTANESKQLYQKALDTLHVMQTPPPDLEYKIQLNNAILMVDALGQKEQAIETISELRKEIGNSFEKYSEGMKPKIQDIMDLMDENLQIWQEPNE